MRIKLRLGGVKDADLIALYVCPGFCLPAMLQQALRSYVRGNKQTIRLPESPLSDFSTEPQAVNVPFDNEKDADVIRFLQNIRIGYRTAAIKSIFRNMLESPYIAAFAQGETRTAASRQKLTSAFNPDKANRPRMEPAVFQPFREPENKGISAEEEWDLFSEDFVENY